MSKKRKAIKFDRVSSDKQEDGFSLEAQDKSGEKYAKSNNLVIVKSWAVSESASKENDRRHFFEMIDYIKENNIKDAIFDKVDRACRGLKSAVMIEDLIDNFSVKFHFPRESLSIDRDSPPQEKLRFYLGVILGKYYIDNMKVDIKKGQERRKENGLWASKAPLGYLNRNKKIIIENDLTSTIKEIFELYSTGNYGWVQLAEFFNNRFPERENIGKTTVERMIVNPFYYGDMLLKGKVIKASHKPIIDKKLFDKCQKIKGIRAAQTNSKREPTTAKPFMKMMTCGVCGHEITGEIKKAGKYIYYHCANAKCAQRSINTNQNKILEQLRDIFSPFAKFTPKATNAFIENLKDKLMDLDAYTQRASCDLADERVEIKKNINKLERLHRNGTLTDTEYKEVLDIKNKTLEEKTDELVAFQNADLATYRKGFAIIELFTKVNDFMELNENLLEKARLVKLCLSNLVLTDGNLDYHWVKPFDDIIELAQLPVWWSIYYK